ncbi:MAG: ABC transporter ATP-binding protein, partial [Candidatus Dormibacteraceae bacterium]
VQETRKAGATIFLSSHILSEVEHVCDRIGIIRSGRLVQVASLSDLHEIRFHHVEITFAGDPPTADLLRAAGLNDPNIKGSRVTGYIQSNFESLMKLLGNRQVLSFTSHEPSLEEVFLTYYKALPHSVETATGRS